MNDAIPENSGSRPTHIHDIPENSGSMPTHIHAIPKRLRKHVDALARRLPDAAALERARYVKGWSP
jgi:hypothetical protein